MAFLRSFSKILISLAGVFLGVVSSPLIADQTVSASSLQCENPGFFAQISSIFKLTIKPKNLSEAQKNAREMPNSWAAQYNLGHFYYLENNFNAARESFLKASDLASHPNRTSTADRSKVFYNLGNTYYRLEQFEEAALAYETSLKLNPHDSDTAANLALTKKKIPPAMASLQIPHEPITLVADSDALDFSDTAVSDAVFQTPEASTLQSSLLKKLEIPDSNISAAEAIEGIEKKVKKISERIASLEKTQKALETTTLLYKNREVDQNQKSDEYAQRVLEDSTTWNEPEKKYSSAALEDDLSHPPAMSFRTGTEDTRPKDLSNKSAGQIYQEASFATIEPALPGFFTLLRYRDKESKRGNWSLAKQNLFPMKNYIFDQSSVTKLIMRSTPEGLTPLVTQDGYKPIPESFKFKEKIKSFKIFEDDLGNFYLSITPHIKTEVSYLIAKNSQRKGPTAEDLSAPPLPDLLKKDLEHLLQQNQTKRKLAELVQEVFTTRGIYTKDDLELDSYLKGSFITREDKIERLSKIYLQASDLPSHLKGKGMDCDCWAELYVDTLRNFKIPSRIKRGFKNNTDSVLMEYERHGIPEVWDEIKKEWFEVDVTPPIRPTAQQVELTNLLQNVGRIKRDLSTLKTQVFLKPDNEIENSLLSIKDPQLFSLAYFENQMAWHEKFKADIIDLKEGRTLEYAKSLAQFEDLFLHEAENKLVYLRDNFAKRQILDQRTLLKNKIMIEKTLADLEFALPMARTETSARWEKILNELQSIYAEISKLTLRPAYKVFALNKNGFVFEANNRLYLKTRGAFLPKRIPTNPGDIFEGNFHNYRDENEGIGEFAISPNGRNWAYVVKNSEGYSFETSLPVVSRFSLPADQTRTRVAPIIGKDNKTLYFITDNEIFGPKFTLIGLTEIYRATEKRPTIAVFTSDKTGAESILIEPFNDTFTRDEDFLKEKVLIERDENSFKPAIETKHLPVSFPLPIPLKLPGFSDEDSPSRNPAIEFLKEDDIIQAEISANEKSFWITAYKDSKIYLIKSADGIRTHFSILKQFRRSSGLMNAYRTEEGLFRADLASLKKEIPNPQLRDGPIKNHYPSMPLVLSSQDGQVTISRAPDLKFNGEAITDQNLTDQFFSNSEMMTIENNGSTIFHMPPLFQSTQFAPDIALIAPFNSAGDIEKLKWKLTDSPSRFATKASELLQKPRITASQFEYLIRHFIQMNGDRAETKLDLALRNFAAKNIQNVFKLPLRNDQKIKMIFELLKLPAETKPKATEIAQLIFTQNLEEDFRKRAFPENLLITPKDDPEVFEITYELRKLRSNSPTNKDW